jgi:hypothetical protein
MNRYSDNGTPLPNYTFLWGKYRPALLKLMVDSNGGPQTYKLSAHEFKAVNPKKKDSYAFTLKVHKNKAINDIRTFVIAKDLLLTLQQSQKAAALADTSVYEFALDKNFLLRVTKEEVSQELQSDPQATIL